MSACTVLFKVLACGMQHMHVYEECGWTRWIGSVLSLKRLRHLWDSLSTLWSGSYLHRMPLIPDMFYCMTDFDLTLSIYCMTKRWPLPWSFARSDTEHSFPFTLPPSLFQLLSFLAASFPVLFHFLFFHAAFIWLLPPLSCGCFSMNRQGLIHSCISNYYISQ